MSSRIAFQWATFPTVQHFDPNGDYGWGMISLGLPVETKFDLKVVWYQNELQKQYWIRQLSCANNSQ